MSRLKARVDRTLEAVLAALMAAMVLVVLWQVATRYLLRDPSSVTEELARFGLIWLGLLAASYGFGQKAHLAIDLLDPEHRKCWLDVIVAATVVSFAVTVLVVGGLRLVEAILALGQTSAALRFERGYVYLALPLSGLLVLFYTIEAAVTRLLHGSS
ncbi:MAG TPA: TRAP transporter small permease [Vicinamibacteria bacterium]|nr:TRAP transporter small permease [Vicinamibacteria bacterium]